MISETYKRSAKLKKLELLENIRLKSERIKCLKDLKTDESNICLLYTSDAADE